MTQPVAPSVPRPAKIGLGIQSPAVHLITWASLHVVLGLLISSFAILGRIHALSTLVLAIPWALQSRHNGRLLSVAAYASASDVLWRMTGSSPLWEYSKYVLILISLLIILRTHQRKSWATSGMAMLYLLALAVSIPLTVSALGVTQLARETLSFSLSGPVALGLGVIAANGIQRREIEPRSLMLAILLPAVAIWATVVQGIASADTITFSVHSSHLLSGGYGPNQVSLILGAGAIAGAILTFTSQNRTLMLLSGGVALVLFAQSIFTFSRGGPLTAFLALAILGIHLIRDRRIRGTLLALTCVVGIGMAVVLPRLNTWTDSSLAQRYASMESTGRVGIIRADMEVFADNFLAGVGPGLSPRHRPVMRGVAAHTEYTRLLAEHGVFGVIALLALGSLMISLYRSAPSAQAKGFTACWMAWSILAMSHAATRIALIPMAFAIAAFSWSSSTTSSPPE